MCSGARDGCTCEYCCFVRDEEDDREMEMEYKVAMSLGQDVLETLNIGDKVEYYNLPYHNRKAVYGYRENDDRKWDYLKECATKIFKGTITSKTEHRINIEVDNNKKYKQDASAAEIWSWGLHKI